MTLQFDGTRYHGWQVQPKHATVQGELERVVQRLTGSRRPVVGSGRTDRGVHALGQVAAVDLPSRWTPESFRSACNALLPADIWLSAVEPAASDFHPRFDAVARTYVYRVGVDDRARSPFRVPYTWPLGLRPAFELLERATERLVGEHAFGGFAKSGQPERGDRCTVFHAAWSESEGGAELRWMVSANRFLHHMVRYLVGTMVDIGLARRPASDLEDLLAARKGVVTSPPAPAAGLFLAHVAYPGESSPAEVEELAPSFSVFE